MTYKWDATIVEKYAKDITNIILAENYEIADVLDGDQLLELTPIKQVNLLIIRSLYEKWKEETKRLESPFFDFKHPEVQFALDEFMNILSQFIGVRQKELRPLLESAIADTFQLALKPGSYFENLLRNLPNFRLSHKWLKLNRKYFIINRWIFDKLQERIGGNSETIFANEAIEEVKKQLQGNSNVDFSEIAQQFSAIIPIPKELIVSKEEPISSLYTKSTKSFFDEIVEEKLADKLELSSLNQDAENRFENKVDEAQALIKEDSTSLASRANELVNEIISTNSTTALPAEKAVSSKNINDKHGQIIKSINDKATTEEQVTDYHRLSKIESIRKSISLNQKFLFINNLFGGNFEVFNKALDEFDGLSSYEDAKDLIVRKYAPHYLWDVSSSEVEEFFEILKRRFN